MASESVTEGGGAAARTGAPSIGVRASADRPRTSPARDCADGQRLGQGQDRGDAGLGVGEGGGPVVAVALGEDLLQPSMKGTIRRNRIAALSRARCPGRATGRRKSAAPAPPRPRTRRRGSDSSDRRARRRPADWPRVGRSRRLGRARPGTDRPARPRRRSWRRPPPDRAPWCALRSAPPARPRPASSPRRHSRPPRSAAGRAVDPLNPMA